MIPVIIHEAIEKFASELRESCKLATEAADDSVQEEFKAQQASALAEARMLRAVADVAIVAIETATYANAVFERIATKAAARAAAAEVTQ